MIVLRIHGGLGNQMFQYAYGRELVHRGYDVVYDTSSYASDSLRDYELDVWRVEAPPAQQEALDLLPRRFGGKGWRVRFKGKRPLKKVSERPIGFHPRFLAPRDHAYLTGYWQGERFFASVADEIREAFRPAGEVCQETQDVVRRIEQTDAVAVHVRRTDYLTLSFTQVCGIDYYQRCVEELLSRHTGLEVFVFSDDLAWCEENLGFACPTHYVGHNSGPSAYEDLWLMSRCRRHVIPNSSFSWWGAWLKEDQAGEVYAPRPWFNDPKWNSSDVVPGRWIETDSDVINERSAA